MSEMNPKLLAMAEHLATQHYTIKISEDELSNGETVVLLEVVELPGCMAHGKTEEEAKHELREAMIEFIYFLLEDGLEVPKPIMLQTVTGATSSAIFTQDQQNSSREFDELLDDVSKPTNRQSRMQYLVIEGNLT
ncbi:MAG: type II toxin-antitoxin system HicB family antitoxin [Anaerolineae bacterium]|nr:type II toxin-antitoxin system HicB family antitoxin [Anaerolineae bacterium]